MASLLLAAISFTLVPVALLAYTSDSDLPACCRKDGKHKCAMSGMDDDASGPAMRGVSQCPMFPTRPASTAAGNVAGAPIPETVTETRFAAFLNAAEQAEAQYRVAFSRSRHKRGPPSQLPV